MRHIRYTDRAERDIVSIVDYISSRSSESVAERFVLRLIDQCLHMSSLPGHMGRERPELGAGIRSRAFGNYIIYFRYGDTFMRVIRIIEAHREVDPDHMIERD